MGIPRSCESHAERHVVHSPEMETLDQLIGADFTLSVIRDFYPSDIPFLKGVHGLLSGGDVRLLMLNHEEGRNGAGGSSSPKVKP